MVTPQIFGILSGTATNHKRHIQIIGFVPYDVCRLKGFVAYEVCRIMRFVANYDVSRWEGLSQYLIPVTQQRDHALGICNMHKNQI